MDDVKPDVVIEDTAVKAGRIILPSRLNESGDPVGTTELETGFIKRGIELGLLGIFPYQFAEVQQESVTPLNTEFGVSRLRGVYKALKDLEEIKKSQAEYFKNTGPEEPKKD